VLVSRAFGLPDPHTYGSGNPGATNVLRTGKKAAAVLTLLGDAFKGWFAVMLVQQHVITEPLVIGAAAVAVMLGHLYPVFHRFQGGKGVATTLGVLLALDPWLAAGAAAVARLSARAGCGAGAGGGRGVHQRSPSEQIALSGSEKRYAFAFGMTQKCV